MLGAGIVLLVSYALEATATVRCNQLAKQAAEYDGFYLAEHEEKMCEDVGVDIFVRFSDEMMEQMNEARLAGTTPFELPDEFEEPEWYKAQQYARAKETAYLNLLEPLKRICACESAGNPNRVPQHYESDGVTVLTGRITPKDTGMCQINLDYHERQAQRMGLDLHDPHDNVEYANWLYRNEGAQPWSASASCWQ